GAPVSRAAPARPPAEAAFHHRTVGALHPLPAARATLASATDEWTRHPARVGTLFLAVPRGDPNGLIAASSLAGIDPARVAPGRVLRSEGAACGEEEGDRGEGRDARGMAHRQRGG